MHIAVYGFNYKKTPLNIREQLSFDPKKLLASEVISECMILSTCNRLEVYVVGACVEGIKETIYSSLCLSPSPLVPVRQLFGGGEGRGEGDFSYFYSDQSAIQHLFRVASSLDAMVIGEAQILGQLKTAYQSATEQETVGPYLHKICHAAFRTAKKIRTETEIATGAVSIGTIAVELIEQSVDNLNNANVLVIGSGEMGALVSARLRERSSCRIMITNRNSDSAETLAHSVGGVAVPFESLQNYLRDADVVVSCVGGGVLSGEIAGTKNRTIIDLAVPRNFDENIARTSGIKLFNIDDLRILAEKNITNRKDAAEKAEKIAEAESAICFGDIQTIKLAPTLSELIERSNKILSKELNALFLNHPNLNDEQKADVKECAESIVKKILHDPIRLAKEELARPGANGAEIAKTLNKLFQI